MASSNIFHLPDRSSCSEVGKGLRDRTRGNSPKMLQERFSLNIRKDFFTKRVVEHCPRLPGAGMEPASLEVL